MKYSLQTIFEQASLDRNMTKLDGWGLYAFIGNGVKISKEIDTLKIKIVFVSLSGDNYRELSSDEYSILKTSGWEKGIVFIAMHNYLKRIANAELRMLTEIKRKNTKEIKNLEELIIFLTDKYEKLKKQYNFTPLI